MVRERLEAVVLLGWAEARPKPILIRPKRSGALNSPTQAWGKAREGSRPKSIKIKENELSKKKYER